MPPPATAAATAQVSAVPAQAGIAGDSVEEVPAAALAERVGDFNISMDPWEQTGAAPQGWASHLHKTVIPVHRCVLPMGLLPGTASENPDSNHPLIRCTSPMSLMIGSSIRFIFPSPPVQEFVAAAILLFNSSL